MKSLNVVLLNENSHNDDQIKDQINDKINDLGLEILKLVIDNPGVKVPEIYNKLKSLKDPVTVDMIRNTIKRQLKSYIIYSGSKKTGGYYLIDADRNR